MQIKCITVGQFETNCYIVTDEDTLECAVIDPGDEANTILDYIEELHLKPKYIFLTHGHFDHTMAVPAVHEETGARVCMNKKDAGAVISNAPFKFNPPEDTLWYKEGDELTVGRLTFRVLETPGHTPGSVSLLCGDTLFSGDTLFRGSCGRTDLPGGDMNDLLRSLKRLSDMTEICEIYPGHMDRTTLARELYSNHYIHYAREVVCDR